MAKYLPTTRGEIAVIYSDRVITLASYMWDATERMLENDVAVWADKAFPNLLEDAERDLHDFKAARIAAPIMAAGRARLGLTPFHAHGLGVAI